MVRFWIVRPVPSHPGVGLKNGTLFQVFGLGKEPIEWWARGRHRSKKFAPKRSIYGFLKKAGRSFDEDECSGHLLRAAFGSSMPVGLKFCVSLLGLPLVSFDVCGESMVIVEDYRPHRTELCA